MLQGKSFLEKEDRNKRKSGKPIVAAWNAEVLWLVPPDDASSVESS